jgi:hypothetical protein
VIERRYEGRCGQLAKTSTAHVSVARTTDTAMMLSYVNDSACIPAGPTALAAPLVGPCIVARVEPIGTSGSLIGAMRTPVNDTAMLTKGALRRLQLTVKDTALKERIHGSCDTDTPQRSIPAAPETGLLLNGPHHCYRSWRRARRPGYG